jgi:5'-deoxynucleotidase YfbR-like HD superfamily hydrolase
VSKISLESAPDGTMLLHSEVFFDVFEPKPELINIDDIAHALSKMCRYGGHCPEFYSVAQHSVICSNYEGTPQEQMEFLMHDASEAYLADVPRPIKHRLPEYMVVEDNLLRVIFEKFNLNFPLSKKVKFVDDEVLRYEYDDFFTLKENKIKFLTPNEAKEAFLKRFYELKSKIDNQSI